MSSLWQNYYELIEAKWPIYASISKLANHYFIMACLWFCAKPLPEPVVGLLSIGPLGTNFSKFLIKIQRFSIKKMHLKTLSARWRPFCCGRTADKNFCNQLLNLLLKWGKNWFQTPGIYRCFLPKHSWRRPLWWQRTSLQKRGKWNYHQISNISRTLVGNKIVDHTDVVGAAPTTSPFST